MRMHEARLCMLAIAAFVIGGCGGSEHGARKSAALQPKWELTIGRTVAGLALGDDGTAYAASLDGSLYAVSADGSLKWKFDAGAPMVTAPSVGPDGAIYTENRRQEIQAVTKSGIPLWKNGGGPFADKEVRWRGGALDSLYYYAPWRGAMRAIQLRDGAFAWPTGMGYQSGGTVSILPSGAIVFTGVGRLDAADSNRTAWQYPAIDPPLTTETLLRTGHPPMGNFVLDSPIAIGADGTLYAAAGDYRLAAVNGDGTFKWDFKMKAAAPCQASPLVSRDGTIYYEGGDGNLYALNPDGSQKWVVQTGAMIQGSGILADDGTIYVVNGAGLVAVSPEGKVIERSNPIVFGPSSATIATDGTVIAVNQDGKIMGLAGTHGPLMNAPWPKFQHDAANTGRSSPF